MIVKKKLTHMFWSDDLADSVIAEMLRLYGIGPLKILKKTSQCYIVEPPNGGCLTIPAEMLKPISGQPVLGSERHHDQ